MNKILLEDLKFNFSADNYTLIIGLGFDQRCLSVLNHFPIENASQIVGVLNLNNHNTNNIVIFNTLAGQKSKLIGDDSSSVLEIAESLTSYIELIIQSAEHNLVIDITSFSHELLVILLGILHRLNVFNKTTLLYVGASEYSFNTSNDAIWLSRGVRSIRSILGFPGIMFPSKKLHLIVLAGFEVERAAEVIIQYEPSSLSIGLGEKNQSISATHFDSNMFFFEKLNLFISEQDACNQDIQHFGFSCIDPHLTKTQILRHIDELRKLTDKNIVICPLNTKLSTVGVALAALESPDIQISYAEPEEYNTDGYSKPGTEVIIVSLEK